MGAKNFYGLTKPQQTIWLSEQFTDAPINNLIGVMYFKKDINIDLLKEATNLPLYHIDMLYHNSDGKHITRDELKDKFREIFKNLYYRGGKSFNNSNLNLIYTKKQINKI